jgi:hypothetical protein
MKEEGHFYVEDDVMAREQIESIKYVELEFVKELIKKHLGCKFPVTSNSIIQELNQNAKEKRNL